MYYHYDVTGKHTATTYVSNPAADLASISHNHEVKMKKTGEINGKRTYKFKASRKRNSRSTLMVNWSGESISYESNVVIKDWTARTTSFKIVPQTPVHDFYNRKDNCLIETFNLVLCPVYSLLLMAECLFKSFLCRKQYVDNGKRFDSVADAIVESINDGSLILSVDRHWNPLYDEENLDFYPCFCCFCWSDNIGAIVVNTLDADKVAEISEIKDEIVFVVKNKRIVPLGLLEDVSDDDESVKLMKSKFNKATLDMN